MRRIRTVNLHGRIRGTLRDTGLTDDILEITLKHGQQMWKADQAQWSALSVWLHWDPMRFLNHSQWWENRRVHHNERLIHWWANMMALISVIWAWWLVPIIPAFGRPTQDDCRENWTSLVYIVSSTPALTVLQNEILSRRSKTSLYS